MGLTRIVVARIEELSPRMRPTRNFHNLAVGSQVDGVVASISIGVQVTAKCLQELLRAIATATHREVVNRVRMLLITDIRPEATLAAAFFTTNENLGDYVLLDFVEQKKSLVTGRR